MWMAELKVGSNRDLNTDIESLSPLTSGHAKEGRTPAVRPSPVDMPRSVACSQEAVCINKLQDDPHNNNANSYLFFVVLF